MSLIGPYPIPAPNKLGFLRRSISCTFDVLALLLPTFFTWIVLIFLDSVSKGAPPHFTPEDISRIIFSVFSLLWLAKSALDAYGISTIGRFLTNSRVLNLQRQRLGMTRALLRNSWLLIAFSALYLSHSGLYLVLGVVLLQSFSIIASPTGQTLTDALAGAVVISKRSS